MSRFFFHLASKDDRIVDTKGRELGDLAAAHRHAMLLIHKMVLLDDVDWRGWSINVTNASNRSVLSVLFSQVSYFQHGNKARQLNRL
jgi:ribosomal protein L13